jgi:hypothetical protein
MSDSRRHSGGLHRRLTERQSRQSDTKGVGDLFKPSPGAKLFTQRVPLPQFTATIPTRR